MNHNLLACVHQAERARHERMIGAIAVTNDTPLPSPKALPGDGRQLRGIPVVGVKGGMGGAIPGTRPTDSIRNA